MTPEPATASDADELLRLRDDAARWIQSRGFQGWLPGEVPLSVIKLQIHAREWFVVRTGAGITAAVRVLDSDELIWGDRAPEAVHVHGLMIDRRHAGRGLGRSLLAWVEETTARRPDRRHVCLDCAVDNPGLRAYYLASGYRFVGGKVLSPPSFSVALFEKALT